MKCSCLAFQDHKIPCRYTIATVQFFRVDLISFIADFYQVSVYRDQYHFSLKPVLLSELELDSILQPPLQLYVTRGRKVVKQLKRTTRETQARRNGRLLSLETRIL